MIVIHAISQRLMNGIVGASFLTLTVAVFAPVVVLAQATDNIAPSIQLQQVPEGRAGEAQVISATVSEDIGLQSVTLYYRLGEEGDYRDKAMQAIGSTSIFTASVPAEESVAGPLQYYIEAVDEAGNRTQEGFSFDPLVRLLGERNTAAIAEAAEREPQLETRRRLLYGALGVLALGVLVAAADGGDSGSGNPQSDDPNGPTDVPTTIVIDPL